MTSHRPQIGDVVRLKSPCLNGPEYLVVDFWREGFTWHVVCARPNWLGADLDPRNRPYESTFPAPSLACVGRAAFDR